MTETQPPTLDRWMRAGLHLWAFSLIFSVVVAETLAILLFLLWLPSLRRRPQMWTPLDLPVLVFLGVRLLSIATSVDPAVSVHALRKIPFLLFFFPLSRFVWCHGPKEIVSLLRTQVLSALAVSAYGLLKVSFVGVYRLESTTGGPTTLAMFLSAVFVVGIALAVAQLLRPVAAWVLGFAGVLWAMAFTYNRAPWFAAVGVGVALVSRWRRWMSALVLVAAAVVVLVPGFRVRNAEVLHWPPQIGDRLVIWEAGWKLVDRRPILGYGPETFGRVFDRRHELQDRGVGAWHNFALQILVESGILGLLAFLWVLIEAIQLGRSGRRRLDEPYSGPAATALLAGVDVLLIAGLFGGLIGDPVIDLLFWGLVGMLAGLARTGGSSTDGRSEVQGQAVSGQ